MKTLKKTLPFAFAVVLLFVSVLVPILLCRIQDAALMGVVHTKPVSTAAIPAEGQPLTMPEKIELICQYGHMGANIALNQRYISPKPNKTDSSAISSPFLSDECKKSVIAELQKLVSLGAFPSQIPLNQNWFHADSTIYTYTDMDHPGRTATLHEVFLYSYANENDFSIEVWFDEETSQIYQYSILLNGNNIPFSPRESFHAFSQYLGLNGEQEKLYLALVQENEQISILLRALQNK